MHPGSNRVYAQSAPVLGAAELAICVPAARAITPTAIAGRGYLTFDADEPVVDDIARLSVTFALFERRDDALVPVPLPTVERYDDDLVTIQRYPGKTNESFTKLLVNLTARGDALTLLDPMAGRGTTLHQAVLYGWNAIGVEIDKTDCEAYRTFFTTWLKNKRLPHKAKPDKASFRVSFGPDRATFDAAPQSVEMHNADSRALSGLVKKNAVDAVVCDLPYGVRHGSEGAARQRSALRLLEESLDGWRHVLRPGGAIGLAFNVLTCARADVVTALGHAGFEVHDEPPYLTLAHRVDQSINRDVVVTRRR